MFLRRQSDAELLGHRWEIDTVPLICNGEIEGLRKLIGELVVDARGDGHLEGFFGEGTVGGGGVGVEEGVLEDGGGVA